MKTWIRRHPRATNSLIVWVWGMVVVPFASAFSLGTGTMQVIILLVAWMMITLMLTPRRRRRPS